MSELNTNTPKNNNHTNNKTTLIGLSFKPIYFDALNNTHTKKHNHNIDWLEIHPENYMNKGGINLLMIEELRQKGYPISLHGVSLNLGGTEKLDKEHLSKLKQLEKQFNPIIVSEHLAWSRFNGYYLNDLLPFPYNKHSLRNLCDHINETQDFLGRKILIENPSVYIAFNPQKVLIEYQEPEFMNIVSDKTGCGILLDINNIYVSSCNTGINAHEYLKNINLNKVEQIHLAGHSKKSIKNKTVLIDTHSTKVIDEVWQLFLEYTKLCTLQKVNIAHSMIEWDSDLPDFQTLIKETNKIKNIIEPHQKYNPERAYA